MSKTRKLSEFDHFNKLSGEWWSETGKYKILHELRPLRLKYILDYIKSKKMQNYNFLDLGCGGGLICESLARLGGHVTGIDFVEKNIEVAKFHAKKNNLKINYYIQDIEKLSLIKKYDVIILFEVLEHIDHWESVLKKIKKNLKNNGLLFISTINRNIISNIFAIKLAENILNWVPKNTHKYKKLITPNELEKVLIEENYSILNFSGLTFNPILREWKLNRYNKLINYFCVAKSN